MKTKGYRKRKDEFMSDNKNHSYVMVTNLETDEKHDFVLRYDCDEELSWFRVVDGVFLQTEMYAESLESEETNRRDCYNEEIQEAESEIIYAVDSNLKFIMQSSFHNTNLKRLSSIRQYAKTQTQEVMDKHYYNRWGTTDPLFHIAEPTGYRQQLIV